MSDPLVSADDFALYLNNSAASTDPRAVSILASAQALCETIVYPLPKDADGVNYLVAAGVIKDVAERAYANPTSGNGSALELYSEGVGPFSSSTPGTSGGGLWLTQNNKLTLKGLAKTGGAFSVDLLANYCPPTMPFWDTNDADLVVTES